MNQDKAISIRCEGQEYHDIEDLIPFQGKLKSISSDNFHKLKESIKSDGIPLGFHIWKQKDKTYIMDGHHRKMALQALKDDGYFIPPVPCNIVKAKTKKEAAKIVLISNSKYSRVSEESLADYMIDMELKVEDLDNLDIPELKMNDFNDGDFESNGSNELSKDLVEDLQKNYSDKIASPIYSPKKDIPPEVTELFFVEKYNDLIEEINNSNIPKEIKNFLLLAASRHIIFNYENIAEFYCHQKKEIQDLMEKSALIIIDFNKAVENGFVKLTGELNDIYEKQQEEVDEE